VCLGLGLRFVTSWVRKGWSTANRSSRNPPTAAARVAGIPRISSSISNISNNHHMEAKATAAHPHPQTTKATAVVTPPARPLTLHSSSTVLSSNMAAAHPQHHTMVARLPHSSTVVLPRSNTAVLLKINTVAPSSSTEVPRKDTLLPMVPLKDTLLQVVPHRRTPRPLDHRHTVTPQPQRPRRVTRPHSRDTPRPLAHRLLVVIQGNRTMPLPRHSREAGIRVPRRRHIINHPGMDRRLSIRCFGGGRRRGR